MAQTLPKLTEDCTASCGAGKGTETGPFGMSAIELYGHGLAVVPCPFDSDNGKSVERAVQGHDKWRRRPPVQWVEKMAARWKGNANVGIVTSLSKVTVVDVDGPPELVAAMIERCGDTPLKTRTPSGGVHLWYRHSGEHSGNLRNTENIPVDVKGRGGSVIVVPPSIRPSGDHAGKAYEFIAGSWDDLPNLPKVRPGALPTWNANPTGSQANGGAVGADVVNLRTVKKGQRSYMLLKLALREAQHCDDDDALLDAMRTVVANSFEDHPEDPFTDAEIRKTVASAWEYQVRGDNWAGREARVYQG